MQHPGAFRLPDPFAPGPLHTLSRAQVYLLMSRTVGAFTKSEVEAAIKGAIDAGMDVGRVEIISSDGSKVIITKSGVATTDTNGNGTMTIIETPEDLKKLI